jgi:hypothetical protein
MVVRLPTESTARQLLARQPVALRLAELQLTGSRLAAWRLMILRRTARQLTALLQITELLPGCQAADGQAADDAAASGTAAGRGQCCCRRHCCRLPGHTWPCLTVTSLVIRQEHGAGSSRAKSKDRGPGTLVQGRRAGSRQLQGGCTRVTVNLKDAAFWYSADDVLE